MAYLVLDTETTIENSPKLTPNPIGSMAASPFLDSNKIVVCGTKAYDDTTVGLSWGWDVVDPGIDLELFKDKKIFLLVGQNIAFDLHYLRKHIPDFMSFIKDIQIWDIGIVEYILTAQQKTFASLDELSSTYGGTLKDKKMEEYWEAGVNTPLIPTGELGDYLTHDVLNTEKVFLAQYKLAKEKKLFPLINTCMESRLATWEMEYNGCFMDHDELQKQQTQLSAEMYIVETKVAAIIDTQLAGTLGEIKVGSSKQLSLALFGGSYTYTTQEAIFASDGRQVCYKSGLKKGQPRTRGVEYSVTIPGILPTEYRDTCSKQGKKGWYSFDDNVVQACLKLAKTKKETWPVLEDLATYKKLKKTLSTYVEPYLKLTWPDGCIHPSFNHNVTRTGRLSSSSPNLQNVSAKNNDTTN